MYRVKIGNNLVLLELSITQLQFVRVKHAASKGNIDSSCAGEFVGGIRDLSIYQRGLRQVVMRLDCVFIIIIVRSWITRDVKLD